MSFCTVCGNQLPESGACSCQQAQSAARPQPPAQPVYPPQNGYQQATPPPQYQQSTFTLHLKATLKSYFSASPENALILAHQNRGSFVWLLILGVNALLTALAGMFVYSWYGDRVASVGAFFTALLFFVINYFVLVTAFFGAFQLSGRKVDYFGFMRSVATAQLIMAPVLLLVFIFNFFLPEFSVVIQNVSGIAVLLILFSYFKVIPQTGGKNYSAVWLFIITYAVYLLVVMLFGLLRAQIDITPASGFPSFSW